MSETRFQRVLAAVRPKTWLDWVIAVVIVAVLVSLLLPGEWVSSGSIEVPVRVIVFDAADAAPIAEARVAIVRAPPATGALPLEEYRERFSLEHLAAGKADPYRTGVDGAVIIRFEFPTGASHVNPEHRAHTSWYWVIVSAEGYGPAATPVRYEPVTTEALREQGELVVSVGLFQSESVTP